VSARPRIDPARLAELFHRAVALAPAEQLAFLARECGSDEALRARVAGLLANDTERTDARLTPREAPRRLGKYTLLELLGEGGMGAVWLARSDEPARLVALKTVRVGTGSPESAARLTTELRALATLDHPSIARVLDAGTSESGLPWFALEFVPGRPITEHCERAQLDLPARIALFRELCAAVQHAHQRGLVHRDIKPANVLVHERDGSAQVKLIDFGVLFAEGGLLAGDLAGTDLAVVGTLAHMSPEQADPQHRGLDTQSDVYALGVLLYELLAGVEPHDPSELAGLAPRALLTRLHAEPAPLASARVAALEPAERSRLAAARGLTGDGLVAALRGDLDLILVRALATERSHRYASASELAADLARHLADQPVSAGAPPFTRRLIKFARRHRGPVLALGGLALIGAGALVASVTALREANAARAAAERELAEARYQARKGQAFLEFVEYAFTLADPGPSGRDEPGVRELLRRSTGEIEALFAERPAAEAAVHHSLGHFFLLLGDDELALEELHDARRLRDALLPPDHPDRFVTLTRLVQVSRSLGTRDAEALAAEALAQARRLYGALHPELSDEVERVLSGAVRGETATEEELAAVEALLAALPAEASYAEADMLTRLLVEAGLASASGSEYFTRLEQLARERLGPGSLRHLVLQWKLTCLALRADQSEYALALRFARELRERATAFLARDHWLVLDSWRLEGMAQAGLWLAARDPQLLAAAELALWQACDAPRRPDAPSGAREEEVERGFVHLEQLLSEPEARHAWLAQSRVLWSAQTGGHTWWPVTRPALEDVTRELALIELTGDPRPLARAHEAIALGRLGRSAEALRQLEALTSEPALDALVCLTRALAARGQGRAVEPELLRRIEGDARLMPCEATGFRLELERAPR